MVYDPSRSLYTRRFRQLRADEPPPPPEPRLIPFFVAEGHAVAALEEVVRLASEDGVVVEVDASGADHGFMADSLRAMLLPPFEAERIRFKAPRPSRPAAADLAGPPAPEPAATAVDEDEAAFFAELEAQENAKGPGDDGDD